MAGTPSLAGSWRRRLRLTPRQFGALALLLVVAAAGGVGAWLLVRNSSGSTATTTAKSVTPLGPIAATAATLLTYAKALGRPIYWVGPQAGGTYEFTETRNGNVYVRYLPKGVRVGDKRAAFVVVGTYPYPDALKSLEAIKGAKHTSLQGGGVAVSTADPKSVHIAYPDVDYQIEIYDPVPGQALASAIEGKIGPIH